MVNLPNRVVIPSDGQASSQQPSPQPVAFPYAVGTPKEGPQSFLAFMTIPTGQLKGTLSLNLSQFGMSMVQSILVDNEANLVGLNVKSGYPAGVNFGIPASGTQIIPVFQIGTLLPIDVTLLSVQTSPTVIGFQIFNTSIPPASWVSSLAVSGNVNVAGVGGSVNVQVNNASLLGVSVQGATFGGDKSFLVTALTTTVLQVKAASGVGTLKGYVGQSAALGWLQFFDIGAPGGVTLGTTTPAFSFPVGPISTPASSFLPPEGLAFTNGLQVAWTTTINNATAPAANFQGNIIYV